MTTATASRRLTDALSAVESARFIALMRLHAATATAGERIDLESMDSFLTSAAEAIADAADEIKRGQS